MEQVATGHDFSIMALVMQADPVVKAVMLMLALASVVCWALIIEKAIRLLSLSGEIKALEKAATDPSAVGTPEGLLAALLGAAESEAEAGDRNEPRGEIRARIERAMRTALKTKLQSIETGLPFLATIGSAGPFIGLFGTVWGIMNSFTSIAQRSDTSLAVVAPGIAEALFATAIGLAAAIPAVMAYNAVSVSLGRSAARATTAIAELAKRLSRREPETSAKIEPFRAGKIS